MTKPEAIKKAKELANTKITTTEHARQLNDELNQLFKEHNLNWNDL